MRPVRLTSRQRRKNDWILFADLLFVTNHLGKMAELQGTPGAQDALAVAQLELEGNPNALALRRPFDPVAHDLDASFRLTRFADLKG